jgi:hypothetical protein
VASSPAVLRFSLPQGELVDRDDGDIEPVAEEK